MTPAPHPTPSERAEELEVAAKIVHDHGNPVFTDELARKAHHLRMQAEQEQKNETH